MDNIDEMILAYLKENARMRVSDIANEVHLSATSVIDRMHKLENSGIIKQYTAIIDRSKGGKDITAFTNVRVESPKYNEEFIKRMKSNDEITECHYITGDYDFLIKIVTGGSGSLQRILDYIKCSPGVILTRTNVVLSTDKHEFSGDNES